MSVYDFTEKQVNDFKEVFDSFDKTGDGTIAGADLGVVIRSLGYILTQKELGALVDEVQTHNAGRVEFNKFLVLLNSQAKNKPKGAIPLAAFRHIMTNTGECLSNAEIDELLKSVAVNSEGHINISTFTQLIATGYKK
ncbi:Calmodulin [Aphelenchoides fujianensis]|nr:Calmodulin [Aphelenchoides fujianensis]